MSIRSQKNGRARREDSYQDVHFATTCRGVPTSAEMSSGGPLACSSVQICHPRPDRFAILHSLSSPPWTLRPARPDDRGFLLALKEAAMRRYVEQVWGWDDAEQAAYFDERFVP